MGLFDRFKTTSPELEGFAADIESNMANNYKDAAQQAYKSLTETFELLASQGRLSDKQKTYYEGVIARYSDRLKGYSHKDQKPYWTK